jgi:hypothetical protein
MERSSGPEVDRTKRTPIAERYYSFDCCRRAAIQAWAAASVENPGISLLAHSGLDITTVYWPFF